MTFGASVNRDNIMEARVVFPLAALTLGLLVQPAASASPKYEIRYGAIKEDFHAFCAGKNEPIRFLIELNRLRQSMPRLEAEDAIIPRVFGGGGPTDFPFCFVARVRAEMPPDWAIEVINIEEMGFSWQGGDPQFLLAADLTLVPSERYPSRELVEAGIYIVVDSSVVQKQREHSILNEHVVE